MLRIVRNTFFAGAAVLAAAALAPQQSHAATILIDDLTDALTCTADFGLCTVSGEHVGFTGTYTSTDPNAANISLTRTVIFNSSANPPSNEIVPFPPLSDVLTVTLLGDASRNVAVTVAFDSDPDFQVSNPDFNIIENGFPQGFPSFGGGGPPQLLSDLVVAASSDCLEGTTFCAQLVPEPASLSLLGVALAGLGLMRRRKGGVDKAA